MVIAFNFLPYSYLGHGGAEVYLTNLANTFAEIYSKEKIIFFVNDQFSGKYILPKNISNVILKPFLGRSRGSRIILEQTLLPLECKRLNVSWLISNYTSPMLGDFKKITIIHDLLVKRFPSLLERNKQWFWNVMFPISIRRSNLIGTVSNFSASEIEFFYPFAKRKLFVTAEGIRPSLLNNMSKPLDIKFNLSKSKYILCVATFAPHKNLLALVKGFEAVIKTLPEMKLVFIGKAKTSDALAYQEKIIDLVKKKGLSDRIVFLGHVDDIDFSALYSNAKATILPSLYEGFGLPIIESQFFGTPVLCSQRASMPEIAGDAAITFNPDNPSDIGAKIIEISLSESLRKKLSEKCADNIKRFTWENAANDLMSAIKTGNCQRSCRFF